MNIGTVKTCLSLAIAKAAQEEAKNLVAAPNVNRDRIKAARYIEQSLQSLRRLSSDGMPDYDQWDPLLYVTWYQASQVNLAYSVLNWANNLPWWSSPFKTRGGRVQVVDFGCGALAVQFAVALAAADTLESGAKTNNIRVDSFDSSTAMMKMGARVWMHFKALLKDRHPQDPLSEVVGTMEIKLHRSIESIEPISGASRLLTAVHAVYESNKQTLQNDLRRLTKRLRPSGCFLTTYSGFGQLLDDVSPLLGDSRYTKRTTGFPNEIRVQRQFSGTVEDVFEWRRKLWTDLNIPLGVEGINYWFVRNMLSQSVSWQYRTPAVQAYFR